MGKSIIGFRPKTALLFTALSIVLLAIGINTSYVKGAPAGNSTLAPLQPLSIFSDTAHGQWSGGGDGAAIETNGGSLPIDTGQSYNGLPSYRFNVTGTTGWWLSILAGSSWESYSIDPYVAGGALEFNVKGNVGGEDFRIAVSDVVFERNPKYCEPVKVDVSNYLVGGITNNWQAVSIPLADLVGDGSCSNVDPNGTLPVTNFDATQIYSIILDGYPTADHMFWVNDIKWTSPDSEPIYSPIKVNQLGYSVSEDKNALISGFSDVMLATGGDAFEVRRSADDSVAYQGTLSLITNYDAASGEKVLKADFTSMTEVGSFYLAVNNLDSSATFQIGNDIYDSLVVDSMRYFFYQRQGIELTAANAGDYTRGVGHPQDSAAVFESNTGQSIEVMKGWYDAGDYGKYVNAGATAVSDLLWAYELFSAEFPDNHLNIPEGGNGVPDILDEARWELEWMLKMQDTDGGFYHMVKSKSPEGGEWDSDTTPDVSPDTRYIRDNDVAGYGNRTNVKPTSVTASAVAGLAHAAVIYQPFDAAFAAELLQAAEDGWTFLQNNPGYIGTIVGAPYTIPYEDYGVGLPYDPDFDDRAWASAALFRATGNTTYRDDFDARYSSLLTKFDSTSENSYGVGNVEVPAVLAYFAASNQTPSVMADLTSDFATWRAHMLDRSNNSVWQHTLQDEDYYWGSNYPNLTSPLALAVGSTLLGTYDGDIVDLSRKSLGYTLGINSMQFSYVSGYGENSLERPFSQIYNWDNKVGVPAGILVGGANEYNNPLLYSNFPQKKFSDNAAAWSTNEHTVYWNAVLVFHAALAASEAGGSVPPTPTPTSVPTAQPTTVPTIQPTVEPTTEPTIAPTVQPTVEPTTEPTIAPTVQPTVEPTTEPTIAPTVQPTVEPTTQPTVAPTAQPTAEPTIEPTAQPTAVPTTAPTIEPTAQPTVAPTVQPTVAPPATPQIFYSTGETTTIGDAPSGDPDALNVVDSSVETLREERVNGSSRTSALEHTWSFDSGSVAQLSVLASVARQSNDENDDFTFAYSTDNQTFIDMFVVSSDVQNSFAFDLPANLSGTIYIRVLDTDRSRNNRDRERVYVDYLVISAESVTVTPTPVPTVQPTVEPTIQPTIEPTAQPTVAPTIEPTAQPTVAPTAQPTVEPTVEPTVVPTIQPTVAPTIEPTVQPTLVPTIAPTIQPTPEPTVEPTPEPSDDGVIYASSSSGGDANSVTFADEDILAYDRATGAWSLYFDGSDVGMGGDSASDTDAFHLLDDGSILLSVSGAPTLPDVGLIDDSDIVRFVPTSTGSQTAGTFEMYFDGSDVELTSNGEDVDSISVLANGDLILSTAGGHKVSGASGKDEDLIRFIPTQLGDTTSGSWAQHFDGSDVDLATNSGEDIWGVSVDGSNGDIYLTSRATFDISGLAGEGADVFVCQPSVLGSTTACTFAAYFDGIAAGFGGELMDGLHVELPTAATARMADIRMSESKDAVAESGRAVNAALAPAQLMSPDSIVVSPSTSVTYPVFYTETEGTIGLLAFELEFDEALLSLDEADLDGDDIVDGVVLNLPAGFIANAVVTDEDEVRILTVEISAESGAIALPSGQIATITFDVSADAVPNSTIEIPFRDGTVELLDQNEDELEISEDRGSLFVSSPSAPTAVQVMGSGTTDFGLSLTGVSVTLLIVTLFSFADLRTRRVYKSRE